MLTMVDRQKVIYMYRVDGMTQRAIHRQTGFSRSSIKKIIDEYDRAAASTDSDENIDDVLSLRPSYDSSRRGRRRLTDEMVAVIEECLRENKVKDATGRHKMRMRKCDIYDKLRGKGFVISYPTVCNYIRKAQKPEPGREAFIRQHYLPGAGVEFDWGEVKIFIGGRIVKLYMAAFTFQYSNCRYAYLFRHQNTLAFLEAHRNFFRDIKGVPVEMVYDNMRVAIKDFLGTEKLPTEALLRLSDFYGFRYRFCNTRAGWEKGHVERSVEYVRRKAFCDKERFGLIQDAQEHLAAYCRFMDDKPGSTATLNKKETVREDLSSLMPLPGDIGCFEVRELRVDKWSTFCLNNVHYSVPDSLVGQRVRVKVYSEKVVAFSGSGKAAWHERSYKTGDWKIDLMHYLKTMQRKPGALRSSEALSQAPADIKRLFDKHFKDNPKDFVLLLVYASSNGYDYKDIIAAYHSACATGVRHLTKDHITAMLGSNGNVAVTVTVAGSTDTADRQERMIEAGASTSLDAITGIMDQMSNSKDYNNVAV